MKLKWNSFKRKVCLSFYKLKFKWRGHKELYERVYKLEELVAEFHGMQTSALEGISKFSDLIKRIDLGISEERDKRLKQVKSLEKKIKKDITVFYESTQEEFDHALDQVREIHAEVKAKEDNLEGLSSALRKEIGKLTIINNDYAYISDLAKEAKDDYDEYLERLRKDVTEFKATDQAVRRLASLEGRITMIEGKLQ